MTTVKTLFAEDIYLKGKPLSGGGGVNDIDLTTVENNIVTINATIAGLTGVKPPTDNSDTTIRDRPPTSQDDINEKWHIADLWIADKAYVCMDNSEGAAVWKVASLEIDDDIVSSETTYSSSKISSDMKSNIEYTDYKLSLKANISDVNTFLSSKANTSALTAGLSTKAAKVDTYTKPEVDTFLNDTNDMLENFKAITYTKTEVDSLYDNTKIALNNLADRVYTQAETDALIKVNADADKVFKETMLITVNDIEGGLNSKAWKEHTYTKTETNNLLKANVGDYYTKQQTETLLNDNTTEISQMLNQKADKTDTYTKSEVVALTYDFAYKADTYKKAVADDLLNLKADKTDTYTKAEVVAQINSNKINTIDFARKSDTYTRAVADDLLNLKADASLVAGNTVNIQSNKTEIQSVTTRMLNSLQGFPINALSYDIWGPNSLSRTVGSITVAVSSILPNYYGIISAPKAFDNITSGSQLGWISDRTFWSSNWTQFLNGNVLSVKTSSTTLANYTLHRTVVDGVETGKQWISIDCGESKTFLGFRLHFKNAGSGNNFKDYHIVGSNDNNSFTSLYHTTNEDYSMYGRIIVKPFETTNSYRYYRIVVNDILDGGNGVDHVCVLQEWELLQPFDLSGYASTDSVSSISTSNTSTRTDLDKLINVLNTWFQNGTIPWNGMSLSTDRIRDYW